MNRYIIGIDVGGTNIKLGLVNSNGVIVARSRLNTKAFIRDKNKLIQAFVDEISRLILRNDLKGKQIIGIGMGLPGFIDPEKGLVRFLPNIPGWHQVPLANILQS